MKQPGDSGLRRKTFIVGRTSVTRQMDGGVLTGKPEVGSR